MSASKISRLASFFYRDAQTILEYPVIAIYYINYKGKVAPGQKKDDQMSVILVPMKWGENGFVPDPCEYLSHSQLAFLSENHGELCPDGCPEEGN